MCTSRKIGSLASFEHAVLEVPSPFGWEFLTLYHFIRDNFLVMGMEIIPWGVTSCLSMVSVAILHGEPWPIRDFIRSSLGVATDGSRKVVLCVLGHLFLQHGCTIPVRGRALCVPSARALLWCLEDPGLSLSAALLPSSVGQQLAEHRDFTTLTCTSPCCCRECLSVSSTGQIEIA